MTNTESIINFVYFTTNFPPDFIGKVWGESYLTQHLSEKFLTHAENGMISAGGFIRWFQELDRGNQTKLTEWINENYRGISI